MKRLLQWNQRKEQRIVLRVAERLSRREEVEASEVLRLKEWLDAEPDKFSERAWFWANLASHFLMEGKRSDARSIYEKLDQNGNIQGLYGLARCEEQAGNWVSSHQYWMKAVEQLGAKAPIWLKGNSARSLVRAGKATEARDLAYRFESAHRAYIDGSQNTSAASALRFEHLVIVSYGRTGSTLLQGVLNAIDGVLVRGENNDVFRSLWEANQKLVEAKASHGGYSFFPNHAWFGMATFNDQQWMNGMRQLAQGFLRGTDPGQEWVKCLGFKEVRFVSLGRELGSYLAFLEELLPNCGFLLNTRRHEEVLKSGFWKGTSQKVGMAKLQAMEDAFHEFALKRANCFEIPYSALNLESQRLRDMHEFLGAEFDEQRIKQVLNTPHSYAPEQKTIAEKIFQP